MIRQHPIAVDSTLHFTDHFARYGFAIVPGLVSPEYCARAVERVAQIIKNPRPLREWDSTNTPTLFTPYFEGGNDTDPVFDELLEQPHLTHAIHQLHGNPALWNRAKNYYLFLKPFDARSRPGLTPRGHIDFPSQRLPPVYCGFTFQVSLVDTEQYSGNITVHPASHIELQRRIIEDPSLHLWSGLDDSIPQPPPFEFVARAGDVLFMSHLIFHSSNASHAANRSPRVAIHAEAFSDYWPGKVDPTDASLSPYLRHLAHNGPVVESIDTQRSLREKRWQYVNDLKRQRGR